MMPEENHSLSELLGQVKGALQKELPGHYWVIAEIMEDYVEVKKTIGGL